jgi:hypothetical protein
LAFDRILALLGRWHRPVIMLLLIVMRYSRRAMRPTITLSDDGKGRKAAGPLTVSARNYRTPVHRHGSSVGNASPRIL